MASPPDIERLLAWLRPLERLHDPVFAGFEHVPDARPLLFVGNHTLMGVLDVPFFFAGLWREKRIFPRALGDHAHFAVPGWRDALAACGVVDGTRDNLARLFADGECVLVFPGGAREVFKRKGEAYRLIWKTRAGFARLAIAHGATIVPFAAVGIEDALDVVADAGDLGAAGRALAALGLREDLVPPLVRGLGPTPIPRPERLYFRFEPAIPTAGLPSTDEAAWHVREAAREAVERGILALRAQRDADPARTLRGRLRAGIGRRLRWRS